MTPGFAALRWDPKDGRASERAATIRDALAARSWRFAADRSGWLIAVSDATAPGRVRLSSDGLTLTFGWLFDATATAEGRVTDARPALDELDVNALARRLIATVWGGYVLVRAQSEIPGLLTVFRDPIGMVECTTWPTHGVRVVTSRPEDLIMMAPPPGLRTAWETIGGLLRQPHLASECDTLEGIATVPPGVLRTLAGMRWQDETLWRPGSIARRQDRATSPARLPALVDACVAAWCSRSRNAIAELSGGLDSALIAAGVARCTGNPVANWLNYRSDDPPGDERLYARLVADHLDVPLVEVLCMPLSITEAEITAMPVGIRPGLGSTNLFHDQDLADRARDCGADLILTGQGGDALFFQDPSLLIAAELRRAHRSLRARTAAHLALAHWTGTQIWRTVATAIFHRVRQRAYALPDIPNSLLKTRSFAPLPTMRWLDDTADLTPAKQFQILSLADVRSSFGTSWCSQVATVAHPLLAQPLIEAVLPISAFTLTEGRRDRAAIRRAYAGRLPPQLLERRGKGRLNAFFGRRLAASIPFLQAYLLDGLLVHNHLLDRDAVEAALDADKLAHTDLYGDLLIALLVERWARGWQERVDAAFRTTA